MTFIIWFNRAVFVLMMVSAFFLGAVNAGRVDLLAQKITYMTIAELTNLDVKA